MKTYQLPSFIQTTKHQNGVKMAFTLNVGLVTPSETHLIGKRIVNGQMPIAVIARGC